MTWATDRLDALKAGTEKMPPVTRTLRMGLLDDWGEGWIRKRWTPEPEILNGNGSMFGGYIAALADQAASFATMTVTPDDRYYRTLNLQMTFIRVARAHPLEIEATVIAKTRQSAAVRVIFRREDGEVVAEATAQQLFVSWDQGTAERRSMEEMSGGAVFHVKQD